MIIKGMGITFGSLIADRRGKAGLTQRELANKVLIGNKPISIPYLSDIENDRRQPESDHLIRQFALALDLDPDYLHYLGGRFPESDRKQMLSYDAFSIGIQAFRQYSTRQIKERKCKQLKSSNKSSPTH